MTTTPPSGPGSRDVEAELGKVEQAAIASEDEAVLRKLLGVDLSLLRDKDEAEIARTILTQIDTIRGASGMLAAHETALTDKLKKALGAIDNSALEDPKQQALRARVIIREVFQEIPAANLQEVVDQRFAGASPEMLAAKTNIENGSTNETMKAIALSLLLQKPELAKDIVGFTAKTQAALDKAVSDAQEKIDLWSKMNAFAELEKLPRPKCFDLAEVEASLNPGVADAERVVLAQPKSPPDAFAPYKVNIGPFSRSFTNDADGTKKALEWIESTEKKLEAEKEYFRSVHLIIAETGNDVEARLKQQLGSGYTMTDIEYIARNPDQLTNATPFARYAKDVIGDLGIGSTKKSAEDEFRNAQDEQKNPLPDKPALTGDAAQKLAVTAYLKSKGLDDREAVQGMNYMLTRTAVEAELARIAGSMGDVSDALFGTGAEEVTETKDVMASLAIECGLFTDTVTQEIYWNTGSTPQEKVTLYFTLKKLSNGTGPARLHLTKSSEVQQTMRKGIEELVKDADVAKLIVPQLKNHPNPRVRQLCLQYLDKSISSKGLKEVMTAALSGEPPAALNATIDSLMRKVDKQFQGKDAAKKAADEAAAAATKAADEAAAAATAAAESKKAADEISAARLKRIKIGAGFAAANLTLLSLTGGTWALALPAATIAYYGFRPLKKLLWDKAPTTPPSPPTP